MESVSESVIFLKSSFAALTIFCQVTITLILFNMKQVKNQVSQAVQSTWGTLLINDSIKYKLYVHLQKTAATIVMEFIWKIYWNKTLANRSIGMYIWKQKKLDVMP